MSRDIIETLENDGLKAEIFYDPDPESPREWYNMGTMCCWHRRYRLGDEQPRETGGEYKARLPKGTLILPLYLYDHSGITISTSPFSCPWDSGQIGFIYATPAKIRESFAVKRITQKTLEQARKNLISEVETYDQYLRGEVYAYRITTPDDEVLDCCYGFFGLDYCRQEAADALAYLSKRHGLSSTAERLLHGADAAD